MFQLDASKTLRTNRRSIGPLADVGHGVRAWSIARQVSKISMIGSRHYRPTAPSRPWRYAFLQTDRRLLSGIVHALRCGGRWADCADVYGPKKMLYNRLVRWSERSIWEGIFGALASAADAPDRLFIDSSCIKVHRCAGGAKGNLDS